MKFTIFGDKTGCSAYAQDASPFELIEAIRTTVRDCKDALPMIKFAEFGEARTEKGSLRHDANVVAVTGIEVDYDGGQIDFQQAVEIAQSGGVAAIVYTSPSYLPNNPKWRVLCPFSTALSPGERDRMLGRLAGLYAQHGVSFDVASWALSQSYYFGTPRGGATPLVEIVDGRAIDCLDQLDATAIRRPNGIHSNGSAAPLDEAGLLEEIKTGASFHQASARLLGKWFRQNMPRAAAEAQLRAAFECVFPPDRDARWQSRYAEIPRLVDDIYLREAKRRDEHVEFTIGSSSTSRQEDAPDERNDEPPEVPQQPMEEWPDPLGSAAYHGLAGDIVMAIEPHTEADNAAILLQLLVAAGNAFGRQAFFLVEDTRHHPNLFVVLVGKSAKARKGTSWGRVRGLFGGTDWARRCITEGLSTGEGLIHRVRDQIVESKRDKNGNQREEIVDSGVADKRLLAFGEEFARMLRVMQRQENTLSAILREAWDGNRLEVVTKHSAETATGAHISVISHVTIADLIAEMDTTMTSNGLANRFLYCCVRRSKLLPRGGRLDRAIAEDLTRRLWEAVARCPNGEISLDLAADQMWCERYEALTADRLGMYGDVTGRAEAQVTRLALIYALLDSAPAIGVAHLAAALEVWRYADASARRVFGDKVGDRTADAILAALRRAGPNGMSRSDIRDLFGNRMPVSRIDMALDKLRQHNLARCAKIRTAGRSVERWSV